MKKLTLFLIIQLISIVCLTILATNTTNPEDISMLVKYTIFCGMLSISITLTLIKVIDRFVDGNLLTSKS